MYLKISTSDEDRSHDRVNPKGLIADNFINNPVVSGFHEYGKPSVGRALQLAIGEGYVISKMEFPPEGINPDADILHGLYKAGFQHAASIGFIPVKSTPNDLGGRDFDEWEMIEYALVLVPDNPKALRMMYEKGFNPETFEEDFGVQMEQETEEKKEVKEPGKEGEAQPDKDSETQKKSIEEAKEAPEKPTYTEETKLSELTVAQLKTLMQPAEVETKDVSQVIQLAYVLDVLSWYIYVFEQNEVAQSSIDKLNQALGLVLQVVQEQAELGKKDLNLADFPETKDAVRILAKAGRAISGKHEDMLKAASDYMSKAAEQVQGVLSSVDEQEAVIDGGEKQVEATSNPFFQKLANSLKTNNQKQDLTLRLLKELKGKEGGDK